MEITTPQQLFIHQLKTMYNVEKRLVDKLDQMSKEVTADKLKQGFQDHRDETSKQVDRLEKVFMHIDVEPEEKLRRSKVF